jgi:hypothetical protein
VKTVFANLMSSVRIHFPQLYCVIDVETCEKEWAVKKYYSGAPFNGTIIADSDCTTLIQPVV